MKQAWRKKGTGLSSYTSSLIYIYIFYIYVVTFLGTNFATKVTRYAGWVCCNGKVLTVYRHFTITKIYFHPHFLDIHYKYCGGKFPLSKSVLIIMLWCTKRYIVVQWQQFTIHCYINNIKIFYFLVLVVNCGNFTSIITLTFWIVLEVKVSMFS